jgi:NAD(P)-dependent dehydrogenase (short-subunit alcohol dehydrogenase family)
MNRLQDKTALITGGGSAGIGRATARRMVDEGAHVFIIGRRTEELDAAVAEIGSSVTAVQADVTVPGDLDRVYDAIRARGRGLDIVFANAAASTLGGPLADMTTDVLEHVFAVNVTGTFLTVQKALPLLNEGAAIILNGSTAMLRGMPGSGAYAASKAAIRSFARTWAAELAPRGIRVNVVSPGPTDTAGLAALAPAGHADALKQQLASLVPVGRLGRPEEVAAAVAFLASEESSFMLGANVFVDGGTVQV